MIIVRKEIAANLHNLKIYAAFGPLLLFFLLSAHLLAIDYQQRLDNWNVSQAAQQDAVVGGTVVYKLQGGYFFHSAGTAPDPPVNHPLPLSVLVKGMDREVDRAVNISQRIAFGPRQDENSMSALFDTPDALFVVKLLISLLALFFSVDAITREKESGTLRVILSNPIHRREFMLGKSVGAFISLAAPFLLAYLSAISYLYVVQGLLRSKDEMIRVLLVCSLSLIYGLVFILLGLFISTVTHSTKTAIVTAILMWGTLVLVLPSAIILAAKLIDPAPSYNQFTAHLYESQQKIIQEELKAHPGAPSIFDVPDSKEALYRLYDVDQKLTDEYLIKKWKEIDQARNLAVLSPAVVLSCGLSDTAGTGGNAYHEYLEFLRTGRDAIIEALKRQLELLPEQTAGLYDQTLKEMTMRQRNYESTGASARSALKAASLLAAWALLFGVCFYRRFTGYDLR